jgi:hypothetical protein
MYGRTDITPRTDTVYMGASDTVAKEGTPCEVSQQATLLLSEGVCVVEVVVALKGL